jgi:hypothetical protein
MKGERFSHWHGDMSDDAQQEEENSVFLPFVLDGVLEIRLP